MSDYSEERHNILKKMANISQEIEYNRARIESDKNAIKDWETDMVVKQKEIEAYETELYYLMTQLKDEFHE